jgi:hypothetical protein
MVICPKYAFAQITLHLHFIDPLVHLMALDMKCYTCQIKLLACKISLKCLKTVICNNIVLYYNTRNNYSFNILLL